MQESPTIWMEFNIETTWDTKRIDHDEPVRIILQKEKDEKHVIMEIFAPFFNDPPAPQGEPGKPFDKLWDYEVVEAFFLGADERYLEVEFCPHGQHLLLLLNGRQKAIKTKLPVNFSAEINKGVWHGVAEIPAEYFPPRVNLFNAYAIHGSGEKRVYEALYPVPNGHFTNPDFHRLEFFRYIEFSRLLSSNVNTELSDVWKEALKKE